MAESTFKPSQSSKKTIPLWGWGLIILLGIAVGFAAQSPFLALAIVVGIIAMVSMAIMLIRPWYITYLLIMTFPFISTLPRDLLPIPIKMDELLIIFGLIAFFISPAASKRWALTRIDLGFFLLVTAGTIFPIVGMLIRKTQPDWLEVIALIKPFLLYRLVVMTIDSRYKLTRALILLLLPPILVSVIAPLQLLNIGEMQKILAMIYYDSPAVQVLNRNITGVSRLLRATSTLGNWNALGSYSTLAALLSFSLWRAKRTFQPKNMPAISFGSSLGSLLLSGSSSSLVGFITGGSVVFVNSLRGFRIRKHHVISVILIFLFLLIMSLTVGRNVVLDQINRQSSTYIYDRASEQYYPTHGIPASVVTRWYLAEHLFGLMLNEKSTMFFGFGRNEYSNSLLPWGTPESGYVGMIFFYGPLYLLVYLGFLFMLLRYSQLLRKKYFTEGGIRYAVAMAVGGMTVAMGLMNLIASYYSAAGTSHIFIITSALMMGSVGNRKKMSKVYG